MYTTAQTDSSASGYSGRSRVYRVFAARRHSSPTTSLLASDIESLVNMGRYSPGRENTVELENFGKFISLPYFRVKVW